MRKLLLLALLLYNIIAMTARGNSYSYDYDDMDGNKRHSLLDDRRKWRKKALLIPMEDHRDRDWDRRTNGYDNRDPRYMDEPDPKMFGGIDRQRDNNLMHVQSPYRQPPTQNYEDDQIILQQSLNQEASLAHASSYMEKELDREKKSAMAVNCERPQERYEACFAGCASVTCDNPRDRLRPCYPFCEPGCICVHPYVRDDRTHKCVLPEECTKGLKGVPDLGDET